MSIKEVLNFETRTEDNLYDIHFFYEGGWWRAYELSAYLCNHLESDMAEIDRLKPTKRIMKDETEYVLVGLQLSSFGKYLPTINLNNQDYKIDEGHMVINVKDLYQSEDYLSLINKFNQWKSEVPLKEKKEKGKQSKSDNVLSSNTNIIRENTLFGIAQKLLSYPIYDKTPNENTQFLINLKQELISIII